MGEPVGVRHVRALIVAALVAVPALAHEIGTTQVTARFNHDHTYDIDGEHPEVVTPETPVDPRRENLAADLAGVVQALMLADGVTVLDCADSGPEPAGLDAVTVNV